jgi:hypothetical protein
MCIALSGKQTMAKDYVVWVVHWTYCEYGGPSHETQPSYHLTQVEAEAYKEQREGDFLERDRLFFEDGYRYLGSEPSPQLVGKAEYKRIKALGNSSFLGPKK